MHRPLQSTGILKNPEETKNKCLIILKSTVLLVFCIHGRNHVWSI